MTQKSSNFNTSFDQYPFLNEKMDFQANYTNFQLKKIVTDGLNTEFKWPNQACIYGGSFNPWHQGHSQCVKLFIQNNDKNFPLPLFVVPDQNPQKESRIVKDHDFENWETLKTIYMEISTHPNIFVYPKFLISSNPNPTVDWIFDLIEFPSLLMGDDTFYGILTWKDAPKLLNGLETLYIVPRLEDMVRFTITKSKCHKIAPKLKFEVLDPHPYQELSSTDLRENSK